MSRMSKYYDEDDVTNSRYRKHEELYKEISKSELENFEVKSNATVIGENKNEIDVEKIKKILDTKYNEAPKRQSIRLEEVEEVEAPKEVTKEYDINVILEKAKEQLPANYEEDRLKKLRDTQFDILKNLDVLDKEEEEVDEEEEELKELINTITINENNAKESESTSKEKEEKTEEEDESNDSIALDLFSDLKGDENTEVLEGLKERVEEADKIIEEKTSHISDTGVINSFYTTSNALDEKDFEDIDDFSKSIESNNVGLKIIVAIIIVAILVGIGILVKTHFFS